MAGPLKVFRALEVQSSKRQKCSGSGLCSVVIASLPWFGNVTFVIAIVLGGADHASAAVLLEASDASRRHAWSESLEDVGHVEVAQGLE